MLSALIGSQAIGIQNLVCALNDRVLPRHTRHRLLDSLKEQARVLIIVELIFNDQLSIRPLRFMPGYADAPHGLHTQI